MKHGSHQQSQIVEEEILITKNVESRGDIVVAKLRELENWSADEVFTEVVDYGQRKMSTRWVIIIYLSFLSCG